MCCLLFVVSLCVVTGSLLIVRCSFSVFVVRCLLEVACCLLFVVCCVCLLCDMCCLFGGCCWSLFGFGVWRLAFRP